MPGHGRVDAQLAVFRGGHFQSGPPQEQVDQLAIRVAVFDDEDAAAGNLGLPGGWCGVPRPG